MPLQHVLPVEEIPQAREHVGCAFPTSNDTFARFLALLRELFEIDHKSTKIPSFFFFFFTFSHV